MGYNKDLLCCFTLVNFKKYLNENSGCNLRACVLDTSLDAISLHSSSVYQGINHEMRAGRVHSAWSLGYFTFCKEGILHIKQYLPHFGQQLQRIRSQRFGPGRTNGRAKHGVFRISYSV